ncbi:hypothetical protein [Phytomonospora endophytica]|uniref:Uncharacterized protein (TIGR03083 family) n=1 Tax=Phytomonospora endophytica TaxID=714109 RepID=A0A841FHU9_9ACTN|nr:hypothetical protein [Phytomonospora endophytica]MBB6035315.1 uncharacterized protein (TIGR03083 family) [Phytomonospora endophytica]GIG63936.1 hypothetical protein Pen01_02310 [Phytomonospora endophytica]
MTPSTTYRTIRHRMIERVSTLDAEARAKAVPALPGWSVHDTYAHLTGICTDVLTGRLTTMAKPEWTAGQVADRAGLSLEDVCAEWAKAGPDMDAFLAAPGNERSHLLVQDAWQHEQDIAGALGMSTDRDAETCAWMAAFTLAHLGRRWPEDLPAVRVVADPVDRTLGTGPVAATLHTELYELARLVIGRRSRDQILALNWEGDPVPMLGSLHTFPMPVEALTD